MGNGMATARSTATSSHAEIDDGRGWSSVGGSRVPTRLFVDGRWRPASDDRTLEVVDPSTGTVLCAVADAAPEDGAGAEPSAPQRRHSPNGAEARRGSGPTSCGVRSRR